MIGIIGAMQVEVEQLLKQMKDEKCETVGGICFHKGMLEGVACVVAQCGIGKVAAAVCAQTLLLIYKPQVILFEGVAGGIGPNVHIGDLVIGKDLVQHDMDTSALGDPVGFISGLNTVKLPVPKKVCDLLYTAAQPLFDGHVCCGTIATGDQFISSNEKLHQLLYDFGAVACEMEGGAVAQVCCMAQVPYGVLRAISDNGDDNASVDFPTFAEQSAHKLAALVVQVLPQLAAAYQ